MKVLIKYIWTLILIPALVFLKGDLSVDTYMHINEINVPEEISHPIKTALTPPKYMPLIVKIRPIPKNKDFSADGLPVYLYDENYNLLLKSQVVHGFVHFEVPFKMIPKKIFKVVSPTTADEMLLDIHKKNIFCINEAQLNDSAMQQNIE